jgi:hypothetical protein
MGKTYRRESDSFDRLRKKSKTNKHSNKSKPKFDKNKAHEPVEPEE